MSMFRRVRSTALIVAFIIGPAALDAQAVGRTQVTLEQVADPTPFIPEQFGPARWLPGENAYTTVEPSPSGGAEIVRYDAATGQREVLVPAARLVPPGARGPIAIANYAWSPDKQRLLIFTNTRRVWRDNTRGDYWVLDRESGALRQLGGPDAKPATLMFAKFSPDGQRVAYVRENDLYVEPVAGGAITRLTHDGSRTTINGTTDWVYEEELSLRDAFRWSPDSKQIAYWQFDVTGVRDFLLINDTDSLYSFTVPVQYPKAGTTNSAVKVGVVAADGGTTRWFDIPGDPREHYIARMEWLPPRGTTQRNTVMIQRLDRPQQTLEVFLGDAATGQTRTFMTERDSAWVDIMNDAPIWTRGNAAFTWLSERDGWRHLWVVPLEGCATSGTAPACAPRLVTRGDYDVERIALIDEKGGWVYFIASPDDAARRYLYRTRLDGSGQAQRVTPASLAGTNGYSVAPSGEWAIHTWSRFDTPPGVDLVRLPAHTSVRTLASNDSARAHVAALAHRPVEFFRVTGTNGVPLDGWMMRPADFDSTRTYPVLFHVYGEPAAQTVVDDFGWETYLFHLMMTQHGYVVVSIDNRGTPAPRGRAWRKSIYRKIGVISSEDQAAAARALFRQRSYLDSTRVAVWGWSGGGSMSLNLIFRSPELYGTAMAVAPVPDMHLYDTIYQERYMGVPQQNEQAYRDGSPLTFADRLRGNLLVVHGSGDDNVHYQGTERLVNALVAANKPFTMMVYPNRTHGIYEGPGTTLHLYSLLTRYLEEHVRSSRPASN
jgi:dipeptidyl-peptidase 4